MKKAVVYILAVVFALGILTACSANGTMDLGQDSGNGSAGSGNGGTVSASPAVVTPDPDDGVVQDEDGIITDDDTGMIDSFDSDTQHRSGSGTTGGNSGASSLPAGTPGNQNS